MYRVVFSAVKYAQIRVFKVLLNLSTTAAFASLGREVMNVVLGEENLQGRVEELLTFISLQLYWFRS